MKMEKSISAITAIAITALLGFLLAKTSTDFLESYGFGLFIGAPLVCGIISVWIYNRKGKRQFGESLLVSFIAGLFTLLGFLVIGYEGLICIAMAAPITLPMFLIGGCLGYFISRAIRRRAHMDAVSIFLVICLPFFIGAESRYEAETKTRDATTAVIIDAPIADVWREVIEFSEIPDPEEFMFRMGIAYPINAKIEGHGVGAVRYCNFSTGAFVEPITHWEENRKLAFDVLEQPHPMKEVSFYDHIHPPHLDWAIQSTNGQFLLNELEDGRVELQGTTWFITKMSPEFYWASISEEMIHMIHSRVLNHIKASAESRNKQLQKKDPKTDY